MRTNIIIATFLVAMRINCGNVYCIDKEESDQVKEWLVYKGRVNMPNIVLISGDEEYRSEEALPQLAKILSIKHGFNCTVLFAQDKGEPGIVNPNNLNNIPGLEMLQNADMMIIFTRFRALPDEQMQYIHDYLKLGKPVMGIRTSTHAFNFSEIDFDSKFVHYGNFYDGDDEWKGGFGRAVLGEKWISHHGEHRHQSTLGIKALGTESHPIWNGINEGDIWGPTDVYGVRLPLPGDSQPLVLGQVMNRTGEYDRKDRLYGMRITDSELAGLEEEEEEGEKIEINKNDPMMPIAWIKSYQLQSGKKGKVFCSTIGASTDLLFTGTRRLLVNGVFWCLEMRVPQKANVDIIDNYDPSPYAFHKEEYWLKKKLSIASLE